MAYHFCTAMPCPICARSLTPYVYPTTAPYVYPATTYTYSWPTVDWSPGKGRHRKGAPEVGA